MVATLYSLYLLNLVLALALLQPVLVVTIFERIEIFMWKESCPLTDTVVAQASIRERVVSRLKLDSVLMCFTATPGLIMP